MDKKRPALKVVYPEAESESGTARDKGKGTGPVGVTKPAPPRSTPASERARVADPVERYLAEIRRYPILDREVERGLTEEFVETNSPKIAICLITSNLRLVVKIALEYQSPWMDLLDIIQEGNVGLLQAVRKFDPQKNIRLSSPSRSTSGP